MFLRNPTSLDVSLARGHVTDEMAVATIVVSSVLRVEGDRLVPSAEAIGPSETDPPTDLKRLPLWAGVSVTASGAAFGPSRAPYLCPVLFRIGDAERRLIVFGDRRWERRRGGTLEATAPAPFHHLDLTFSRAFGGGYDLPPGLLPGTDLPHPGMRVAYRLNEQGIGYYPDEKAALGAPLPNVERPDQLVRKWNDQPEPAGFTPCKGLLTWRMKDDPAVLAQAAAENLTGFLADLTPLLRVYHHAPPSLIFADVPPGTAIVLRGLGTEAIHFALPGPPARVTVRLRKAENDIRPKLRALHIDAERRVVRLIHEHCFHYDPRAAPSWVRIASA